MPHRRFSARHCNIDRSRLGIATLTASARYCIIDRPRPGCGYLVGGGTLVAWALIPAAAICGVSSFELARRNLRLVLIGLGVTTVVAMFLN
ncbi:hypothetical protein [Paenibacillus sp. NPDC058071]|uniref:hypothetical protein n=1 Tax=Paenibacillus sp. NPDC058071 TaxID=3346326 RepID=UPI0036DA08EA